MNKEEALSYLPPELRKHNLYIKFSEMLQFIIDSSQEDLKDIQGKLSDPTEGKDEVISAIIKEYGFDYIATLSDSIIGIDKSSLIQFLSLIHLLKGTKQGLSLILTLLGFNFEIEEWWEQTPIKGTPMTYRMTVFINLSSVNDVFAALESIRDFSVNYVIPILDQTTVIFDIEYASMTLPVAGFQDNEQVVLITDTLT